MLKLKKSSIFKRLKSAVAATVSVIVIAGVLPPLFVSAAEPTFTENFNSYKTGSLPSSLATVNGEGATVYVDEFPSAEDKSVALEGTNNNAFIQLSYNQNDPVSGKVYIQLDVRFETVNSCPLNVELRNSSGTSCVVARMLNGAIVALDGSVAGKYIEKKFYAVGIEIDTENELLDMYVNGRHSVRNVSLAGHELRDFYFIRFQLSPITVYSKINIDNLIVRRGGYDDYYESLSSTDSSQQMTAVGGAEEVKNKMRDAAAFYENRNHALINGVKKDIDGAPFGEDGVIYIPVRAAGNNFGAGVYYDETRAAVNVTVGGTEYLLKAGENCYYKDGERIDTDAAIKEVDDRTYASVKTISEIFGKYVFEDKLNGLVIFSNQEQFISWEENLDMLNSIVAEFIYTDYTAEELIAMLKEHNPNNAHPRIMLTAEQFREIRDNKDTDTFLKAAYASIASQAESYMNQSVQPYNLPDGLRLLETSRRVLDRLATLAFMYNVTGDEKYAERAWQEIFTVTYYPNWNENHFLDVAEMSAAFAIGYDWLYDWLSDDQKQRMRTAMINFGLKQVMDDYEDNTRTRTYRWSTVANANNWTFVCNGGLAMAAMAIYDDEAEELCGAVLSNGLVNVRRALNLFAPLGSYSEGSNYWNYATRYLAFYVSSLDSAFGNDLGYFDVPGIRNTVEATEALNGPAGYYNFSDADNTGRIIRPAQMMLFGNKLNKPFLGANRINEVARGTTAAGWEDVVYYRAADAGELQMPLDTYLNISEVMTMRSGYDEDALYVGFHNGYNGESHAHYDLGGFVLDSQGQRFLMDLGSDNYNLPGYYNCYRVRAEGHNTLVINPNSQPDQSPSATAKIVRYESKDKGAFAITDLSEAYGADVNKVERGIMMTEGRSAVVVQDELDLPEASEVYWFAHTDGDIELINGGKAAIISKKGKKLKAEVLSDGKFEIMNAEPLLTSPQVAGQNKNVGIKKLALHFTKYTGGTIAVGFSQYEDNYQFEPVKTLDQWSISDGELIYSKINGINIDGKPLEGFDPNLTSYTVTLPAGSRERKTVTSDGTVTDMRPVGRDIGVVTIRSNGMDGLPRTYTVNFKKEAMLGIPQNLKRISVARYTASDEPQPENPAKACFDNDLSTRWATEGHSTMDLDLGSVQEVYGIAMAFWQGNVRNQILRIDASEDGENYQLIYEGESCGETEEYEVFDAYDVKARYIRLQFYGTSVGTWNSVLGIAVLKE